MVHLPEQSTAGGGLAWFLGQNNPQQMGEKHGASARTIYSRWGRSMVHWPEQSTVGGRKAWCICQNNLQQVGD